MISKLFLLALAFFATVSALAPPQVNVANIQNPAAIQNSASSIMQDGIQNYMNAPKALESSTIALSLKDRPPPPTAEELAKKKANFNFWFWGGGFVAPFLATFYYFGFKFWER